MSSEAQVPVNLLKEAADWAVLLQYEGATERDQQAFDRWCRQSPAHAEAWTRASAVFATFEQASGVVGNQVIKQLGPIQGRRRSLRALGLLLIAPGAWLAYRHLPVQQWTSDVRTITGERRSMNLSDGSVLVLNSDSAVDILFTETERRIRLIAGEVLITTHADPAPVYRPFLVDTALGSVRALGTRFSVRQLNDQVCQVAVFASAVEVHTRGGATQRLQAGQQTRFTADSIDSPAAVASSAVLWEHGMLLARDMRLADVIAEMARHRSGMLRCDPQVADWRVSGAISLADTDAGLGVLASSLPLEIERRTRYWVTVRPRKQ